MDYKSKGATYLDKLCHKLYDEPKGNGIKVSGECQRCGGHLSVYYCEERLYLIVCEGCGTVVLTKACSPQIAANLTIVEKDANAQNLRVSKIIARAEAAEKDLAECREKNAGLALALLTEQPPNSDCLGDQEWQAVRNRVREAEARAEKAERERDAAVKKYEAEKEDFLDYALSGTQNAAPFCRNRHPDCVDKRGWCIPVKCHGFSRDKED